MAYRLGIVGHEAKKFTTETEMQARLRIRNLFATRPTGEPFIVVSGGCHLGGIDIWAIEEAKNAGFEFTEHLPATRRWSGGYKERNIEIARDSDKVVSIVVKTLPPDFQGYFNGYCYHCHTDSHIKSGGCWTARYAGKLGKPFDIIEI